MFLLMKDFFNKDQDRKKKSLGDLKNSLRDIAPVRDKLSQIRDGNRDVEELLRDSTFQAAVEDSFRDKLDREEKKEVIKKLLNELE